MDLSLVETDVMASGGKHLESLSDVIGMESRRTIAAGSVVTAGMLRAPTVIKRGDTVRISANQDGLAVVANGTALSNGRRGEQIRVENSQSERVVRAKVLGPGEAEVVF